MTTSEPGESPSQTLFSWHLTVGPSLQKQPGAKGSDICHPSSVAARSSQQAEMMEALIMMTMRNSFKSSAELTADHSELEESKQVRTASFGGNRTAGWELGRGLAQFHPWASLITAPGPLQWKTRNALGKIQSTYSKSTMSQAAFWFLKTTKL